MDVDIDWPYYAVVIAFSLLGFVYFSYGKKLSLFWFMLSGLSLMVFGYVCDTWLQVLLWGVALSSVPFVVDKLP